MKKTIAGAFCLVTALVLSSPAKADTWQTKFLVNKATSKIRNVDKAVLDTNGNKWFHAYESGDSNGDGFSESFIYEFTANGDWVDYTDTLKNLVDGNVNWVDGAQWGINSLYADKSGNVWVGATPCTLLQYNGTEWSVVSSQTVWEQVLGESVTGINGGYFYSVFGDAQGNVYATASVSATGIGSQDSIRLIKRSATTGTWSTAISADEVMSYANQAKLTGAFNDTTGDYWFYMYYGETTPSGVYQYHNGSWTNYTTDDGLANNKINSLETDSSGNVWIATDSGVSKFNGSTWTNWTTSNSSLSSNFVNRIAEDNSGRIWFTTVHDIDHQTDGGASIYDPDTGEWSYYSSRNGADEFEDIIKLFFLGDDMWAVADFREFGFTILAQNDLQATLYGQIGGTEVEKASKSFSALKKSGKKRIHIWKMKPKNSHSSSYKRTKTVYNKKVSGWYKALNLAVGKYYAKVQGRAGQVIDITDGDPYRLNFL
ncbi:MAG TPA: two-component regulator propeller domain-containing protein [Candidatus Bathyarchaeia archaeon]|nr:two-component regulator propeller domain-containing protein [Candidatus Bathyarchaeia archaeon]